MATLDADLVRSARDGDVASLGAALELHRAHMYSVAITMLRDQAGAEDAVQEAFIVAIRRLDSLRDPAALGPWLRTIVKNVCRMEIRARREVAVPDVEDVSEHSLDDELERLDLADWVWTAMARLPMDIRATMMLRHFGRNASYAEISTVLGVPIGTVRSRLSQGRRYLADAVTATAAAPRHDHSLLTARRWRRYEDALRIMNTEGRPAPYFADCSADVLVSAPAMGYEMRGTAQEEQNIEAGLDIGVRMRLVRVLTSDAVTVIEAEYDNPPESAGHCPPWHTEIRMHADGPTTRLVLHFGQRP